MQFSLLLKLNVFMANARRETELYKMNVTKQLIYSLTFFFLLLFSWIYFGTTPASLRQQQRP